MKINHDRYITNVEVSRNAIKEIRLLQGKNKTMSQWYNETKADIIVNGALYSSNGIPIESYMTDGKVLSTSTWCKYGFGINWDGSVQFGEANPYYRDFTSAFPMLVKDGSINIFPEISKSIMGINPRTVFSQTQDGVMITTIDGRQTDKPGMTISQLTNYIKSLGVLHAANLDGGGSTHLMVGGKTINSPCENRAVSNVLAIWLNRTEGDGDMKNKIVAEAEKWVGYLEKASNYKLDSMTANAGSNNYTLFAEWYKNKGYGNYQAQPWCAMFVSYVFGNVIPNSEDIMQHFHYCPTGLKWFEKDYRLSLNPEIGDVVFFRDSKNIACHTGIVYNYDSKTVYTIEGNTSSAAGVVANGGAVAKKSYARNHAKIIGYGRPKWEAVQVENKYSYDDTVDNMIKDGVTTTENMAYWEKVLDGREKVDPNSLRTILNRYHEKIE